MALSPPDDPIVLAIQALLFTAQPFVPTGAPVVGVGAAASIATPSQVLSDSGGSMLICNESDTKGEIIRVKIGVGVQDSKVGPVYWFYPGTYGVIPVPAGATHMDITSLAGSPAYRTARGNGYVI